MEEEELGVGLGVFYCPIRLYIEVVAIYLELTGVGTLGVSLFELDNSDRAQYSKLTFLIMFGYNTLTEVLMHGH